MKAVAALLETLTAESSIPSMSLCVRVEDEEVFHHSVGMARLDRPQPVVDDQVYDLASLTKILATTPVAAALVRAGVFGLDDAVARWLPDVDPRICVHHLLSHSSGLPAWSPLYEAHAPASWGTGPTRTAMLETARTTPLQTTPGEAHCYSDLGFLTLLALFEVATDQRFEDLVRMHVVEALGVDLRWGWPAAAATQDCAVRGGVVQGEVDDLNCAALGGVSTHAGLFGTARRVARAVHAIGDQIREDTVLRQFAMWKGPGSHRLGFDSISPGYSSTGSHFPADTVGHLGFTGTSAWTVPSRRTTVVLLTNRLHPADVREDIRSARPQVHDAVAKALGWG
ncbi:MAG: beta-lactamase family protein [Proteobacteria bacterium]|nr:beta-lactamase family protein [Pseudomonadota bacterium]